MNVYTGKICLLLAMLIAYTATSSCSEPRIRNQAVSNSEAIKLLQKYQQIKQASCQTNSSMQEHNAQNSRPYNPIAFNCANIDRKTLFTPIQLPSPTRAILGDSPLQKLFNGYYPAGQAQLGSFKDKKFELSPPTLERDTSQPQKISFIQKQRLYLKASAIAMPIITARLLGESNQQNRFGGVIAATTIASMLPTILTILGGIYAVCKVDHMLHAEERIAVSRLRQEMTQQFQKRDEAFQKEISERKKADDVEKVDRIKADQELRRESFASLQTKTNELDIKITTLYNRCEETQAKVAHACTDISEVIPKISTSLKNTLELKAFIATQIFPTLNDIKTEVATMREREEKVINPLVGNIEYELNNMNIPIDRDEEKSNTSPLPRKIAYRKALSISDPAGFPGNTPLTTSGHASTDIFKKKKEKSSVSGLARTFINHMLSSQNN